MQWSDSGCYDAAALSEKLGGGYSLVDEARHEHRTISGTVQRFVICVYRKR